MRAALYQEGENEKEELGDQVVETSNLRCPVPYTVVVSVDFLERGRELKSDHAVPSLLLACVDERSLWDVVYLEDG